MEALRAASAGALRCRARPRLGPQVRVAAVRPSAGTRSSACRPPPRRSRPPTSSRAPAAISTSARSISAITSRRASCSPISWRPSSITRSRRPRRRSAQLKAALQQAQANRELAKVTWDRDKPLVKQGWLTAAAGHDRRPDPEGAATPRSRVAQANVVAQQAQLQVLHQQKVYQSVVAPFDGVITQRNIDIGSLVQADADQRHLHVHDHAEQRDPHPGLRAAGRGVRRAARHRRRGPRARDSRIAPFPAR